MRVIAGQVALRRSIAHNKNAKETTMPIGPKTWMIAQAKRVNRDDNGNVELAPNLAWLTLVDIEGRDVIPIFTSEEKANEYISATNEGSKLTPVGIRNLGVLAGLLDELLRVEFAEAITIDPNNKIGKGQQRELREFLADLRSNMRPRTQT